jgi:hypothetical protein
MSFIQIYPASERNQETCCIFGEHNSLEIIAFHTTVLSIHSDILPRLFSKFATKSEKGTGLGLFISKSEAMSSKEADFAGAIFSNKADNIISSICL